MSNYIIIDTETGGLDCKESSLLTVGFVMVKNNVRVGGFEIPIHHNVYNTNTRAMEINKINIIEHDSVAVSVEHAKYLFIKNIEDVYGKDNKYNKPTVIGHNIGFDLGFIHSQFMDKNEFEKIVSYRNIDTATIGRFLQDSGVINGKRADLSSLTIELGIVKEDDSKRHSALYDAEITWRLYEKMRDVVSMMRK